MSGPGYTDFPVPYAVRFTWSGNYMHDAYWSVAEQGYSNVSHGCVNIAPANAAIYYDLAVPGDPVTITNSPLAGMWDDGWTEWFLTWKQLLRGSATHEAVQAGPSGSSFVGPATLAPARAKSPLGTSRKGNPTSPGNPTSSRASARPNDNTLRAFRFPSAQRACHGAPILRIGELARAHASMPQHGRQADADLPTPAAASRPRASVLFLRGPGRSVLFEEAPEPRARRGAAGSPGWWSCRVFGGGVWSRRSRLPCYEWSGGLLLPDCSRAPSTRWPIPSARSRRRALPTVGETLTLLAVGACESSTGLAVRPGSRTRAARPVAGGVAGMLVAANPEPAGTGGSLPHTFWAVVGFMVVWQVGWRRAGPSVPYGLRPAVSAGASGVLLGLLVWLGAEVITASGQIGLAERIVAEAQAVWPLAVVLTCCLSQARARTPPST